MKYVRFIFFLSVISYSVTVRSEGLSTSIDFEKRARACTDATDLGEKTLCYIKYDYNNTPTRCEQNDNNPGVLCSGLIIRGTDSDLDRSFHSWNPSPASISSGGVSFSYLRKDSVFEKLADNYVTGFIFYPKLFTPEGKDSSIEVLCGFPLDGWTVNRSEKGCGEYQSHSDSKPCADLGIETASQWYEKYYGDGGQYICGFMLYSSDSTVNTSKAFDAMIKSQILLKESSFDEQNELRLEVWGQDKRNIPIEAFFYLSGSSQGLKSSQKDQSDFYSEFSEVIPIIKIQLPSKIGDDATFSFNKSDQVIN